MSRLKELGCTLPDTCLAWWYVDKGRSVFLTFQMGWTLAAGDIEAAFLNGVEARRDLFLEPPAPDLEGVEPRGLIEIIKGVFGLSTSPRLWCDKLAQTMLDVVVENH